MLLVGSLTRREAEIELGALTREGRAEGRTEDEGLDLGTDVALDLVVCCFVPRLMHRDRNESTVLQC